MYTHVYIFSTSITHVCICMHLYLCINNFQSSSPPVSMFHCLFIEDSSHMAIPQAGFTSPSICAALFFFRVLLIIMHSFIYFIFRVFFPPMKICSPGRGVFFSVIFTIISPEPRIIPDTDLILKEHVSYKVYCGQRGGISILLIVKQIQRLTCIGTQQGSNIISLSLSLLSWHP